MEKTEKAIYVSFFFYILLSLYIFPTSAAWSNVETWNGSIAHTTLTMDMVCSVKNGVIESVVTYDGILHEYKWEIKKSDGTIVGTTGWVDADASPIVNIFSAYEEEYYDITFYGRNDYNETIQETCSQETTYSLPNLPPAEPDPGVIPHQTNREQLPEAGYGKDSVGFGYYSIDIRILFIVIVTAIVLIFIYRKKKGKLPFGWEEIK